MREEVHNNVEKLPTYSVHEHIDEAFNYVLAKIKQKHEAMTCEKSFSYEYMLGYRDAMSELMEELNDDERGYSQWSI